MNGTLKMAITISPPDRVSKYNRLEGIYKMDKFSLNKKLRNCSKYFILFPEVDLQGRLHYHGVIKIDDQTKWYKSVLPYIRGTLGFVLLKPLKTTTDMLKWNIYSMKNWASMKDIFIEPIIITKPKRLLKSNTEGKDLDIGIEVFLKKDF